MKILMVSDDVKEEPGGVQYGISSFSIKETGTYSEDLNQIKYEIYKRGYNPISISDALIGEFSYKVKVQRSCYS